MECIAWDDQADVNEACEYERAALAMGKSVSSHYYEGAPHQIAFRPETSGDVLRRSVEFF
jgi:dipeptidyl aminopeptidase/acylaminoacyl peptidase